jgi:hypothetical protein
MGVNVVERCSGRIKAHEVEPSFGRLEVAMVRFDKLFFVPEVLQNKMDLTRLHDLTKR